jgi:hypothetical protein
MESNEARTTEHKLTAAQIERDCPPTLQDLSQHPNESRRNAGGRVVSKKNANKKRMAVLKQQKNAAPVDRRNRTLQVIVDELHSALGREVADVIKIGELLVEAKDQAGHGEWLPLLGKLSMSPRTAQRYMKAYEFVGAKNVTVAHLKLSRTALYRLSEDEHWKDDYAREAATDAVLNEAATQWVGDERAIEIIERARVKEKAREEAQARAMSDELKVAERHAAESGDCWEDTEFAWKAEWIRKNWDAERQAKFEVEWKKSCSHTRQPDDRGEGTAPTISEPGSAGIVPEQTPESEEEFTQGVAGTFSERTPSTRSVVGRQSEARPRGAGATERDTSRVNAMDQVNDGVDELRSFVAARCFDDQDRRMIRHKHTPYLDGFIDEKGKLRFTPSQLVVDGFPQRSNGTVSPEQSAEDMKRKFEALEEASNTPATSRAHNET